MHTHTRTHTCVCTCTPTGWMEKQGLRRAQQGPDTMASDPNTVPTPEVDGSAEVLDIHTAAAIHPEGLMQKDKEE